MARHRESGDGSKWTEIKKKKKIVLTFYISFVIFRKKNFNFTIHLPVVSVKIVCIQNYSRFSIRYNYV